MPAATGADGSADEAGPEITVIRGDPTPEELAAVTAVVDGIARELSEAALESRSSGGRSAWDRGRVALRGPLAAGRGAWQDALR